MVNLIKKMPATQGKEKDKVTKGIKMPQKVKKPSGGKNNKISKQSKTEAKNQPEDTAYEILVKKVAEKRKADKEQLNERKNSPIRG